MLQAATLGDNPSDARLKPPVLCSRPETGSHSSRTELMSPLPTESFPEWLAQIRNKCSKQMGPECEPQRWEDPLGKPWKEEAKEHLVLPTAGGGTGNTLSGP